MGGDIALKLAANVPDLVTAIVMIDCYECNPSPQLRNVSVDRTRLA
jgi:pimeloyl-ACP methyl ester carboxylesterase